VGEKANKNVALDMEAGKILKKIYRSEKTQIIAVCRYSGKCSYIDWRDTEKTHLQTSSLGENPKSLCCDT
jgi:hypothetical protein